MIEEHISGEIQYYDKANRRWTAYANGLLSDANVFSASTKNQCCESNKFTIGGTFTGTLHLVCRLPGLTQYQIRTGRIVLRSWYGSSRANPIPRGIFWATEVKKDGDLVTINGLDAMGWTDTLSPQIDGVQDYLSMRIWNAGGWGGDALQLWRWFRDFFLEVNNVLEDKTGIPNMLQYRHYDETKNAGIQYANYNLCAYWEYDIDNVVQFKMDLADDNYKSDKPRDYLHWIAESMGGFITVEGDGNFTMRNFCMPELGIAEIYDSDIEKDTLQLADHYIFPHRVTIDFDYTEPFGEIASAHFWYNTQYQDTTGFDITIEKNPIAEGFQNGVRNKTFQPFMYGIFYAFSRYKDVALDGDMLVTSEDASTFKAFPVPFRCRVHKAAAFQLGQTVMFPDHPNIFDNDTYGTAEHVPYIRSVITEIAWTFRGGTLIACGGSESRGAMSTVTDSKADAVLRELRRREPETEIWTGSSDDYTAMESHAPNQIYACVDEVQVQSQQRSQLRTRSAEAPTYEAKLYIGDVQVSGQGSDIWTGTGTQYEALQSYDAHKLYLTVDVSGQTTAVKLYAGNVLICDSSLFERMTALEAAVTTLQNAAVTSTDIRTISVVETMPESPVATTLYVMDGGAS